MKNRTAVRVTLAMMAIAGLSANAFADDFTAYEGKNTIFDGNGGEKTTVDGIDFWSNGAPPRKFKLLGYIEDTRLKSGLIGKLRMSGLQSTVAKETKKAGGDAAILVDANSETTGFVGARNTSEQASATGYGNAATAQGHSFATGASAAVQKQHTRYAVVKYLAD
ncbi:MAG: hypothetical protein M3N97_00970 [Pseudomonadota bacterium]|nr:hypothetical protein [Pseudomonadota bacterium]